VSARWSRPFAEHARGDRESGVDAVLSGCGVLRMGRAPSGQGPGLVLITPAGPPSLTRTWRASRMTGWKPSDMW